MSATVHPQMCSQLDMWLGSGAWLGWPLGLGLKGCILVPSSFFLCLLPGCHGSSSFLPPSLSTVLLLFWSQVHLSSFKL